MSGNVIKSALIAERTAEIKDLFYSDLTNKPSNQQGWIAESLSTLQQGNLHNESIRIIGKLHQNRWGKEDIFTLLKPHIERVGGDLVSLRSRIESVSKYPLAECIIKEACLTNVKQDQETYSISSFLALDDKVTWIVPGIISDKSLGFIAGLPETGKTWVCMDLAVECARGGGYWLGKFPVKDAKVLYIDQERWKGETKRRLQAIINSKVVSKESVESRLFIKSGTTIRLDLQHSFEAFYREVGKLRPDIVIVDSFATFHTKEENNRKDIQEVLERVKQIRNDFGVAFLFVDHEGKSVFSDEDKTPNMAKMVGSIGKPAAAEYVLTVRKEAEGSMIYHTKSTLGPAVEPFLVKVLDIDDTKTKISVRAY
jgi:KaiC/GvpD/RAD55 family RecA-like ATPase